MRKLTKREWFEAGWMWATRPNQDSQSDIFKVMWRAGINVVGEIGYQECAEIDNESRWFLYSQFCIERAGIPADDR
jgi:hypothetical protein